jgi:hypothetical protein
MLSHIILKQQRISQNMSSGQKGSFETEEQRRVREQREGENIGKTGPQGQGLGLGGQGLGGQGQGLGGQGTEKLSTQGFQSGPIQGQGTQGTKQGTSDKPVIQ